MGLTLYATTELPPFTAVSRKSITAGSLWRSRVAKAWTVSMQRLSRAFSAGVDTGAMGLASLMFEIICVNG